MEKYPNINCPFTEEDTKHIAELKQMLAANNISYNQVKFDDAYLKRFIHARKNVKQSYEMFVKFLEWRKKDDVDNIKVTLILI